MMELVHYHVAQKNPHHGEAILKGFGARRVQAGERKLVRGALHLIGGLQYGSLELMQEVRAAGEPYIFFDRAYFGGGPGSDRLRVVPNAYQKHWLERWPGDRMKAFGVEVKPWRPSTCPGQADRRHILVVPPGNLLRKLIDPGPLWEQMPERLARITGRPVRVSVKGDPAPLAERLRDCWCVITGHSNVAVEALLAGIPAFVSRESAAAPMAGMIETIEHSIERPSTPEGREGWAASLAYGQFTLEEIRQGMARDTIMAAFQDVERATA